MTQALQRRELWLVVAILAVAAPAFFTLANKRDLLLANMPIAGMAGILSRAKATQERELALAPGHA